MVGLSVVLENQKSGNRNIFSKKTPQLISKTTMLINTSSKVSSSSSSSSSLSPPTTTSHTVPSFLEQCFLCKQKLLPGKDIYMYKGDRGFCSVECRCRQIFMDEEESLKRENCCLASMKIKPSTPSPSSSSGSHHHRKAY
ncbi:hypothetical protein Goklo_004779 [Gossypium klotzschianum]|uniref:FLZ-type domain-containing protein n=1 Tax=Gossypium klotzschianum TaxID=34286 RepID=A0A7J8VQH4_9ROSI|nr:hypothetical protein [Gossypium klotzschianum]